MAEKEKVMQKNWIGKSVGAEIELRSLRLMRKLKFLLQDLIQFMVLHSLQYLLIIE